MATTLYHLTEVGRELEPVIRGLVRFGARYMADPTSNDEQFRSHSLAFPASELLDDTAPDGPPAVLEIRTGGRPVFIEIAEGRVRTTLTAPRDADLVLAGPAQLVLGVLTGQLETSLAVELGLETEGSTNLLKRLRYDGPRATGIDNTTTKEISA